MTPRITTSWQAALPTTRCFNAVERYFNGLIDKTEAISLLHHEKPNLQLCFRTEAALARLRFEGREQM